ncbi:DUF3110 domain-containing protein [Trichocoleus sp. FACHB-90]|jgi:hypothetical protein|uniref:DUF3110 domain-containing protein n=1 Tax=Funiculus sociatus GB2-A5 TaxID=2933946 RepID=A0ABV0JRP9_9CYAN|nr:MULTISPECIES: DUF3110 domain-containing protein [unclassified Trichocoleus]MBD1831858.1 DUF3110 domain-containing protein [Cyanobacteria bacterium FACHB-472]MBD1908098.1 DUF3110 domain-containing protein [Trichocoleus sp. FACHB-832]MBD1926813.1 DUF3110 domain-containing protein [Trichocoleus sp. FACHB-90]MBD2061317.1 DUF3110 domain-containing protein [Trichocoleus sp. FACHB-6]
MRGYVLIFNTGTENEGMHSLRIGDRNLLLLFEAEDDAIRYALLLEAQDFATPTVEPMESEEIEEICQDLDYDWKLIPEGFVPEDDVERLFLAPPENNLSKTDWEPDAPEPELSDLDKIRRQLEGLL